MVRRDAAIGVEWLVAFGADEELHGNGEQAAYHDKVEFEAAETVEIGREPWEGLIVRPFKS